MSISGLILKTTSFCDLNCSYCYMFNSEDRTYNSVPKHFKEDLVGTLFIRIREHLKNGHQESFSIVLHGGEPMLWHPKSFSRFFSELTNSRNDGYSIHVSLQTNLLNPNWDLLSECCSHGISIGASLDGPLVSNDKFRRDHSGRGSYARVIRNLERLASTPLTENFGGILSVINTDIPPEEYFQWVSMLPKPSVSILWPIEFNHSNPPWPNDDETEYAEDPKYGKWLAELFDIWIKKDDPTINIKIFKDTIKAMVGGKSHSDQIVNDTLPMVVVNTDGAVERHDYFRAHKDGFTRTLYNIQSHSIKELENDEVIKSQIDLRNYLPSDCRDCEFAMVCGGGFLAGRMSDTNFDLSRRSVLCHDHFYFLSHVSKIIFLNSENQPKRPNLICH